MISDTARTQLAGEWHSLRRSLGKVQVHYTASFARGGWMLAQVVDEIYALFVPFGFSVLEHTLQELREEGLFISKSSKLGSMMSASKGTLMWRDFEFLDQARELRNALAHEQRVPSVKKTMDVLDKIEEQLIEWTILDGPVQYQYTLSVQPST